jgi:hypothetical protein
MYNGNILISRSRRGCPRLSFLLDPFALLGLGFVAGKAYYLLVAFGDRIIKRGALKKNLVIAGGLIVSLFWAYSALLYLGVIYFPWPFPAWYSGADWMLNSGLPLGLKSSPVSDVLGVVVFATYPVWFYLGTELGLAGHRLTKASRLAERNRIIGQVVDTVYPKGGAIPPGATEVGTLSLVDSLLQKIPPTFADALVLLLYVFDSRFFVLVFTGRFKRFVDLDRPGDTSEKRKYLQAWSSNPYLSSATQIMTVAASYGYYTRPQVYKAIGYTGPVCPDLPPWYNPGPQAAGSDITPAARNEAIRKVGARP